MVGVIIHMYISVRNNFIISQCIPAMFPKFISK